jgi:hypothetical protein
MEIELVNGSFLRMADGSKANVVSVSPSVVLRGETGSFYLQRLTRSSGDVTLETPVSKIRIDPNSDVRIDVLADGATTVTTRWGRAVVKSEGGNGVEVKWGYRSYVDPGYLPSVPVAFDRSVEDSFDTWNREQSRTLAVGGSQIPASAGIATATLGVESLAPYGNWVDVDGTYCWQPTVAGFVPYREGYWSYVPGCGSVWVGDYPFSYVTSHYGRWRYDTGYGWLWNYQSDWGPAWVASLECGPDFVWCPLDPFGQPACYWDDCFTFGGLRFGYNACSFCAVDDLRLGRCNVGRYTHDLFGRVHDFGIWNIDELHRNHIGYREQALRTRDFRPDHAFRGRTALASTAGPARVRAAALEGTIHGLPYVPVQANARTLIDRHAGAGMVRNARINPATLSQTRASFAQQTRAIAATRSTSARLATSGAANPAVSPAGTAPAIRQRTIAPSAGIRTPSMVPHSTTAPSGAGHATMSAPSAPASVGHTSMAGPATLRSPGQAVLTRPSASQLASRSMAPYSFRPPSSYTPARARAYSPPSMPSAPRMNSGPSALPAAPHFSAPAAPRFSAPAAPHFSAPASHFSAPHFSAPSGGHSFSHMSGGGGGSGGRGYRR